MNDYRPSTEQQRQEEQKKVNRMRLSTWKLKMLNRAGKLPGSAASRPTHKEDLRRMREQLAGRHLAEAIELAARAQQERSRALAVIASIKAQMAVKMAARARGIRPDQSPPDNIIPFRTRRPGPGGTGPEAA